MSKRTVYKLRTNFWVHQKCFLESYTLCYNCEQDHTVHKQRDKAFYRSFVNELTSNCDLVYEVP